MNTDNHYVSNALISLDEASCEGACRYTVYDINMHYTLRLASVTNKHLIMNENNKHDRFNLETHFPRRPVHPVQRLLLESNRFFLLLLFFFVVVVAQIYFAKRKYFGKKKGITCFEQIFSL